MRRELWAALALVAGAAGCANRSDDPQGMADATTRAVYDVDLDRTTAHFDEALKGQVTRQSIAALSDQMHVLGAYHGLKQISAEPDRGRYDYQAAFDRGTMVVRIRLDPDQKLGAYRVVPSG